MQLLYHSKNVSIVFFIMPISSKYLRKHYTSNYCKKLNTLFKYSLVAGKTVVWTLCKAMELWVLELQTPCVTVMYTAPAPIVTFAKFLQKTYIATY